MFKKFKKITAFIGIMTVSMYLSLSIANTKNAFAFVVPSISGVVNAAGSMADAGEALVQAGHIIGLAIPPIGPFGLATSVNQFLTGKFKSMMNMGKSMEALAKLQTELAKVQSSVNAATNAVTDVYSAESDITDAQNSLLNYGVTMNNCQGAPGILGSVEAENCTENTINSNISYLSGTYSYLDTAAGISGNGISSALAGTSANQAALTEGVNNFSDISENGLGGTVSISPQSNLCQDEIAAGMVTNASQCTESYQEAMNGQLNKNLLIGSTEGISEGDKNIVAGSGFASAASNVKGSFDTQKLELLKIVAAENAQQLKATGELTKQIAISNQAKAAKSINNTSTPLIAKPDDPIKEMEANGWYY